MAPVQDVTSIAVEGYFRSAVSSETFGLKYTMRVGTRIVRPRAVEKVNTDSSNRPYACIQAFEFDPEGEDNVNIVIMDDGGAHGTATFSLAGARRAGHDRLQVPVFSADTTSRRQLGALSLAVRWAPDSCSSDTDNAAAAIGCAPAIAIGSTAAEPRPQVGARDHHHPDSLRTSRDTEPQLTTQHQDRPTGLMEAGASAPGASASGASASGASASGASAPSAAVMAAIMAVAAMVAAASELPALCSASLGCSSHKDAKGSLLPTGDPAAPAVAFYPPIQPYDAAPPLEFGPGQLPTSSSASTAFYPDIALRMHFRDTASRMHPLRPTLSAT